MAITRYSPPFYPDTHKHQDMVKGAKGGYVLYRDHELRVKLLKQEIKELKEKLDAVFD